MSYIKKVWADDTTPISALNMNHIEQGIVGAETLIGQEVIAREADTATKIPLAQKSAANGVATLDTNAKVPTYQIPVIPIAQLSFVIDSVEADATIWELLASKTLSVDTASFSFSGIPSGYTHLRIIANLKTGGNVADFQVYFNAHSSEIFYFKYSIDNGSFVGGTIAEDEIRIPDCIKGFGSPDSYECAPVDFIFSNFPPTASQNFWGKIRSFDYFVDVVGKRDGGLIGSMNISTPTENFDSDSAIKLYGCKNYGGISV